MALSRYEDQRSGVSPQEVRRKRAMAQALLEKDRPVTHWAEGLASLGEGLVGGLLARRADADEKQARASSNAALIAALTGGGAAPAAATGQPSPVPIGELESTTRPAVTPASRAFDNLQTGNNPALAAALAGKAHDAGFEEAAPVPTAPTADGLRSGLIQRGMPGHVADGFITNFKDESGLNPGINEAMPLVPGSRGGFGLAQWTGPRRVALERFAAAKGVSPADPDLQMDFLMQELQGSEADAGQSIMSAQTPQDAAVRVARDFLRPSPENLNRRVAAYSGGPVQMASNDDMAALPSAQPVSNERGTPSKQELLATVLTDEWADPALKAAVLQRLMPKQPIEVNGRLVDPNSYQVLADFSEKKAPKVETFERPDGTKVTREYRDGKWQAPAGETEAPTGAGVLPKDQRDAANQLRDEFNTNAVKPYSAAREGYEKVIAGANDDSASGDIALIFGFMRTLDPNSTVREGEFATAQNAGGVSDTVRNAYNRAISGERLNPEQRQRFITTAENQFGVAQRTFDGEAQRYTGLASQYRIDPNLVIRSYEPVKKPGAAGGAAPKVIKYDAQGRRIQ